MIPPARDVNTEAPASKGAARSAVSPSEDAALLEWVELRLLSFDPEREGSSVVARELVEGSAKPFLTALDGLTGFWPSADYVNHVAQVASWPKTCHIRNARRLSSSVCSTTFESCFLSMGWVLRFQCEPERHS